MPKREAVFSRPGPGAAFTGQSGGRNHVASDCGMDTLAKRLATGGLARDTLDVSLCGDLLQCLAGCSCPGLDASVKEEVRGRRSEETMATRYTHDKAFKQEAVRLVQTSGKSQ